MFFKLPILIVLPVYLFIFAVVVYLIYLLIMALRKYLKSEPVRKEKTDMAKSLGEVIKRHRMECKMTQEFVAEALGVSRQFQNGKAELLIQVHLIFLLLRNSLGQLQKTY